MFFKPWMVLSLISFPNCLLNFFTAAILPEVTAYLTCCVGFCGFLRSGELTAPEKEKFDPK